MRLLLTRSAADGRRTAMALERLGHTVLVAPVTQIRQLPGPRPPGRFDATLATSHHAFDERTDGPDRHRPCFVVGRRTAEAARSAGFEDVRIGTGDAASLADLLRLTLPRPARLLYRAGRDRKPILEETLHAAGYAVETMEVYAAECVDRWPEAAIAALRGGDLDAALHYSRRSVELALALAERENLGDALLLLHHACLSADAAEPLLAHRAFSVAVAEHPDEDGLFALLTRDRLVATPTVDPPR